MEGGWLVPTYSYSCKVCGVETDHVIPYDNRLEPQDCPSCGREASAEYRCPMAMIGSERKRGDSRLIRDERELGNDNWRDEGTTRLEGGAGKKLYFH